MKKTWIKKLKSQSGESISEVLIASLVVSLAFIMVLSLIMASQKIIKKTDDMMEQYYSDRNAYEEQTVSSSATTGSIVVSNTSGTGCAVTGSIDVTIQAKTINNEDYVSYAKKAGS